VTFLIVDVRLLIEEDGRSATRIKNHPSKIKRSTGILPLIGGKEHLSRIVGFLNFLT
jgi:hypothetical protein